MNFWRVTRRCAVDALVILWETWLWCRFNAFEDFWSDGVPSNAPGTWAKTNGVRSVSSIANFCSYQPSHFNIANSVALCVCRLFLESNPTVLTMSLSNMCCFCFLCGCDIMVLVLVSFFVFAAVAADIVIVRAVVILVTSCCRPYLVIFHRLASRLFCLFSPTEEIHGNPALLDKKNVWTNTFRIF